MVVKPEQLPSKRYTFQVNPEEAGIRLDKFITRRMSGQTRSFLGKIIKQNFIHVDGKAVKAGHKLQTGDCIDVILPPPADSVLVPKKIRFDILYEDESILVITKPPGLVVHPGAGKEEKTLIHGLLYHCENLPGSDSGRPGIVHRLDKDTSGVMLVAKTELAQRVLSEDFKQRRMQKQYQALLLRCPDEKTGRIVAPLGRHPVKRKKMAVRPSNGRYAATGWQVEQCFQNGLCWVKIFLETGRTHQIRAHMSSIGCPVAGDSLYGGSIPVSFKLPINRQFLHASSLTFTHPERNVTMSFTAPLWYDIQQVLNQLQSEQDCA